MKLFLTRHGQTDWNTKRCVCGRTEAQLTDLGRAQAAQVGEQAAQAGVNVILASPMDRAQETAAIIAQKVGVPVLTDPLLIEQDFGTFEGRSVDDPEYREKRKSLLWHPQRSSSIVPIPSLKRCGIPIRTSGCCWCPTAASVGRRAHTLWTFPLEIFMSSIWRTASCWSLICNEKACLSEERQAFVDVIAYPICFPLYSALSMSRMLRTKNHRAVAASSTF